jgi:pSer/pThr/pTyr-binding forkhead associated (FHA) protein
MPVEYSLTQATEKRFPIFVTNDTPGITKVAMDRAVCVVGARAKVHLPLPSQLVSKAHAIMIGGPGGVWLRDLGSKNHTFVNNKAVREVRLLNGDWVRFGPFNFRCSMNFDATADVKPLPTGELRLDAGRTTPPRVFAMTKQTFLIGSRYSSDVLLQGDDVNMAHAVVFVRDGRRYLRDLDSFAGTFVNGNPIREAELNPGDEIRIANSRMVYHLPQGAATGAALDPEDTKFGFKPVFRDVMEYSNPQPGPAAAGGKPGPDSAMISDRPKRLVIDIEEASRQENGR